MENRPNYETYRLDELKTVLEQLDETSHPEEVELVNRLIEKGGYTPPTTEAKGLGGWLILVGIGVVISPIRLLIELVPMYKGIIQNDTIRILLTPGTEYYNLPLAIFVGGEGLFNLAMFAASLYLVYLYFSRHYLFPKLYIAITVAYLVFLPLDGWVVSLLIPGTPAFSPDVITGFARSLIAALIWIPYMLVSVRVKATFIEHRPDV